MGTSKQTIELNGHLYDAASGKMIDSQSTPRKVQTTTQVVDGFVRRKSAHSPATSASSASPPSKAAHSRSTPKPLTPAPKKVQRSVTLMRRTVHKPTAHAAQKTTSKVAQHPQHQVPHVRLKRAHQTSQSQLISKFGSPAISLQTQIAPLPVQLPPEEPLTLNETSLEHHQPAVVAPATSHQTKSRFEHGLHHADSHKQPKLKKAKLSHKAAKKLRVTPRILQLSTMLAAFLLLAGFIVYQNVPNLAMKVAATRAGIDASLPGYKPSGFSLSGAIKYSPGQITVSYQSNSDNRSFQLTQRSTQWNNETLVDKFVAVNNRPYQTFQDRSKTIYIYDGSNATWVQDGVWYQVEGNSSLTSEQLLRLATSI